MPALRAARDASFTPSTVRSDDADGAARQARERQRARHGRGPDPAETLSGIGAVTPPAPITVGEIAAGQSVEVASTINVPAGVVRFPVTQNGSYADAGATGCRFSIGLPVTSRSD